MSDDPSIDPETAGKQDDLDYAAGYQARVNGLPSQSGQSPAWFRGWFDADRDLAGPGGN
jgi:hypothetical protein